MAVKSVMKGFVKDFANTWAVRKSDAELKFKTLAGFSSAYP
jgi:hypothetical protein